jgi:DNA-directed RNA polymerase subunit M/transcription elongation factor TFIIS
MIDIHSDDIINTDQPGFVCPACGSYETDPWPTQHDDLDVENYDILSKAYVCLDCGYTWRALYTYSGRVIVGKKGDKT